MNPYVILALVIAWGGSLAGTGWVAFGLGQDSEIAGQAKINKAITETREAAQQGAANAIAKIEVKNVTINRKLETEVREKRVFADCRSGDTSVHLYNSGIPGYAEPADRGVVPSQIAPTR